MITHLFFFVILTLIKLITAPILTFPDVTVPAGATTAFSYVGQTLASLDGYIPVSTIAIIVALTIGVEVAIFTYKGIMWLVKKIPTIS